MKEQLLMARRHAAQWSVLAQQWFSGREAREQRVLLALVATVLFCLLYLLVWQPAATWRVNAQARYESASRLVQWMQVNQGAMRQTSRQSARPSSGNWLTIVSDSARNQSLVLKGISPEGDNGVRVQLQDQPFANVMAWLDQLGSNAGAVVEQIEISRTSNSGRVNVNARISGGS